MLRAVSLRFAPTHSVERRHGAALFPKFVPEAAAIHHNVR